jgi:hypothetical protein
MLRVLPLQFNFALRFPNPFYVISRNALACGSCSHLRPGNRTLTRGGSWITDRAAFQGRVVSNASYAELQKRNIKTDASG